MKIFAWMFFSIYSVGLVLSALPAMKFGFLVGILALLYVGFAQFWVVFNNRQMFKGYLKSSIFHFIPLFIVTYIIGSQMVYFYMNGDQDNFALGMLLALVSLAVPYITLWLQYFLLHKAYSPNGILIAAT